MGTRPPMGTRPRLPALTRTKRIAQVALSPANVQVTILLIGYRALSLPFASSSECAAAAAIAAATAAVAAVVIVKITS